MNVMNGRHSAMLPGGGSVAADCVTHCASRQHRQGHQHTTILSSVSVSAIAIDIMAAPTSRLLHSYCVIAYLHNKNLFRTTIAKSDNIKFYRNRQIILSSSHKLQYGEGEFPDRFKFAIVIPLYKTNFIQVQ